MQHTIHPFAEEPYYLPQHGPFVAVTQKDAVASWMVYINLIVLLLVMHYRSAITGSLKGNYTHSARKYLFGRARQHPKSFSDALFLTKLNRYESYSGDRAILYIQPLLFSCVHTDINFYQNHVSILRYQKLNSIKKKKKKSKKAMYSLVVLLHQCGGIV